MAEAVALVIIFQSLLPGIIFINGYMFRQKPGIMRHNIPKHCWQAIQSVSTRQARILQNRVLLRNYFISIYPLVFIIAHLKIYILAQAYNIRRLLMVSHFLRIQKAICCVPQQY